MAVSNSLVVSLTDTATCLHRSLGRVRKLEAENAKLREELEREKWVCGKMTAQSEELGQSAENQRLRELLGGD